MLLSHLVLCVYSYIVMNKLVVVIVEVINNSSDYRISFFISYGFNSLSNTVVVIGV